MTILKKPLKRTVEDFGVTLMPGSHPLALIKKGKSRKWFEISLETIYCTACRLEAERIRRERAAKKAAKREGKR